MRVIDGKGEPLLNEFRARPCDKCKRPGPSEAAHIFTKNPQLDVRFNLCSLCRDCHQRHHDTGDDPSAEEMFAWVEEREGLGVEFIINRLHLMQRAPKECTACAMCGGKGFRGTTKTVRNHCPACEGGGILNKFTGQPWRESA